MSKPPAEASAEQVPIRRLDWRFLLPQVDWLHGSPSTLLVVGGPPGLAARAREIGFKGRVIEGLAAGPAEIVAVMKGASVRPEDVARSVRPSGVVYWEVDRTTTAGILMSPARFSRRLRRVGLEPVEIHGCLPGFDFCKLYMPLDMPNALPWYLSDLFSANSLAKRLFAFGLRLLMRGDGRRAASFFPNYAVTAVRGRRADESLSTFLNNSGLPSELCSEGVRSVVLATGGDRVVLFPFAPGDLVPRAVVKVPKVPSMSARTVNEHERLVELRAKLPDAVTDGMPVPLARVRSGGLDISVESYLPGRSLLVTSGTWGLAFKERSKDLWWAARWITEFHRHAEIHRAPWDDAAISEWLEQPITEYRERFGVTIAEERLFSAWRNFAGELTETGFRQVWHHRDYNIWNIVRLKEGVGVVDWEGVRPGPPLCDLLHFVIHWNEAIRHLRGEKARLRGFRVLFFGPAILPAARRTAGAVAGALNHYLDRLDLDARLVPLLLVYLWVELALRRSRQQVDMGERQLDPRQGNRNFRYIELLADHVSELFVAQGRRGGVLSLLRP